MLYLSYLIKCTCIHLFHCSGFWWHGCTGCSIPVNINNIITTDKLTTKFGLAIVLLTYFDNNKNIRIAMIMTTLPLPFYQLLLEKGKQRNKVKSLIIHFLLRISTQLVLTKASIHYIFKLRIFFWRLRWIH